MTVGPQTVAKSAPAPVRHIDEFVPDEYIPGEFLEDSPVRNAVAAPLPHQATTRKATDDGSSDEEEDAGNPMVAGFTDEVELDEAPPVEFLSSKSALKTSSTSPGKEDDAGIEVSFSFCAGKEDYAGIEISFSLCAELL